MSAISILDVAAVAGAPIHNGAGDDGGAAFEPVLEAALSMLNGHDPSSQCWQGQQGGELKEQLCLDSLLAALGDEAVLDDLPSTSDELLSAILELVERGDLDGKALSEDAEAYLAIMLAGAIPSAETPAVAAEKMHETSGAPNPEADIAAEGTPYAADAIHTAGMSYGEDAIESGHVSGDAGAPHSDDASMKGGGMEVAQAVVHTDAEGPASDMVGEPTVLAGEAAVSKAEQDPQVPGYHLQGLGRGETPAEPAVREDAVTVVDEAGRSMPNAPSGEAAVGMDLDAGALEAVETGESKAPLQADVLADQAERLMQPSHNLSQVPWADLDVAEMGAEAAARADQQRMIDRIAAAVSTAGESGRTTMRLRLYPPELGTVRIEVSSLRGSVTARIETSNAQGREVLGANLHALRESIRSSGVDLRDVELNYRNTSAHSGPDHQHRQSTAGEGHGRDEWDRRRPARQAPEASQPPEMVSAGLLDVLM